MPVLKTIHRRKQSCACVIDYIHTTECNSGLFCVFPFLCSQVLKDKKDTEVLNKKGNTLLSEHGGCWLPAQENKRETIQNYTWNPNIYSDISVANADVQVG